MRIDRITKWAKAVEQDLLAVSVAVRDPATPWHAKLLVWAVLAYALSPIDLIPDFVPVLGYLDDLVLLPIGIALAVRLIPKDVIERSRLKSAEIEVRPVSRIGAVLVVLVWLAIASWIALEFASPS